MDTSMSLSDPAQALDLNRIREQLIRLEDTITFHLIERAQFPLNKSIYVPGAVPIRDGGLLGKLGLRQSPKYSFMDWYLRQQEALQSRIRRFDSPDENPFFPDAVRAPILRPLKYPKILHPNDVVVNDRIREYYVNTLLPAVCADYGHGDRGETQENYGSSATCDIAVLQALSRRIHFGKFVAESKFQSDVATFTALIRQSDREGLGEAIVNKKVEAMILERMRRKVETFGQEVSVSADGTAGSGSGSGSKSARTANKLNADAVVKLYEDFVIPVTKDVEVEYLMQRLVDPPAPAWHASLRKAVAGVSLADVLSWGLTAGGAVALVAMGCSRWHGK